MFGVITNAYRYTSCYGQSIENTGVWTFRALQQKEAAWW